MTDTQQDTQPPLVSLSDLIRAVFGNLWLIIAGTLVRPAKDIRLMKVKSVKRNWKDKHFAAAVDRDHVREATEDFSQRCFDGKLELWQHIGNVLTAMQGIAPELDLDGRLAQG